jgi:hypothetical protein
MKIGFLDNQINERGGTLQVYLYAKYARDILGHSVTILYPNIRYMYEDSEWTRKKRILLSHVSKRYRERIKAGYDDSMGKRIRDDGIELIQTSLERDFGEFDALYHYKNGKNDHFRPKGTRYWVHACSVASQPHGDRYIAVSSWLGRLCGIPYVPHLVQCADDSTNLRQKLGIPPEGIVFGRYGGRGTFDLPWAWDAIEQSLAQLKNIYFLFANTDVKLRHERIFDLPTIYDPVQKRRFINTSDAMLHARESGEAFGIAVGEFAVCGKRVLTYGKSPERAHIEMLRHPLCYNDTAELKRAIEMVGSGQAPQEDGGEFLDCTPEKVMKMFDKAFIN